MTEPTTTALPRTRSGGILLHPTCLPGPFGIGDLGSAAFAWVEALAAARQTWWQVLPLGPTGFGDSPYQCFSAFAGNPYLVGPEPLVQDGLLEPSDLEGADFQAERVEFGRVIPYKLRLLDRAWQRFAAGRAPGLREEFEAFSAAHAGWLAEYTLFMALKEAHAGASWHDWDEPLILREATALAAARTRLRQACDRHGFWQFLFFRQWHALRAHAAAHGVRILGDVPIFVAPDSADVWSNPRYFQLDAWRRPLVVAGVPPDYFTETGQLWGNPLYDWDALQRDGFRWWVDQLRVTLDMVDVVRLDHFRGFQAHWEVPAGAPTAETGRWVPAPGEALFRALRAELGDLPIVAEDLGVITPEVHALRMRFGLPGMRVLQFACGSGPGDRFLPHHYDRNTIVYTGTHDNDTTRGWYATAPESERVFLRRYLGRQAADGDAGIVWDLIRLAWSSVADRAIVPLQDVLELGTEARLNLPGHPDGNWTWRCTEEQLASAPLARLGELTELFDRAPEEPPSPTSSPG